MKNYQQFFESKNRIPYVGAKLFRIGDRDIKLVFDTGNRYDDSFLNKIINRTQGYKYDLEKAEQVYVHGVKHSEWYYQVILRDWVGPTSNVFVENVYDASLLDDALDSMLNYHVETGKEAFAYKSIPSHLRPLTVQRHVFTDDKQGSDKYFYILYEEDGSKNAKLGNEQGGKTESRWNTLLEMQKENREMYEWYHVNWPEWFLSKIDPEVKQIIESPDGYKERNSLTEEYWLGKYKESMKQHDNDVKKVVDDIDPPNWLSDILSGEEQSHYRSGHSMHKFDL